MRLAGQALTGAGRTFPNRTVEESGYLMQPGAKLQIQKTLMIGVFFLGEVCPLEELKPTAAL